MSHHHRANALVLALLVVVGLLAAGCAQLDSGGPAADVVITNAKVTTLDVDHPNAEAVALRGGKIVAVGNQGGMI